MNMDKTAIILFAFTAIVLVASVAVLLLLGGSGPEKHNPPQRGLTGPRSALPTKKHGVHRRAYPQPHRSKR